MDENDLCTLAPIRPWPSPESVIQTWLDRSHITPNNCIDAGIIQGSVLTLFGPGDPPHKLPLILTVAATGQVTLSAVGTFVSFGQHFIIGLMVAPAPKSNSAVTIKRESTESSLYYSTDRIARPMFHKAENELTEYWAQAHCPRIDQSVKLSSCMM
ncbi:uncharacterized protein AFUA_5G08760 [Aspergillus fumigatus Af293]|uniref:Uncharacterized protein n=1 Tax=Aspergillus fumigatus (strain ATCC MYA-4609 / CBS 101355 / FGSC A1100 / Af293) TaxID=330879 RepID=Q4WUK3_ASPFU|nr:hypothetical protein AFUA_5G08760 [Aspergillus fumigatus Af293]EAL91723.1 hypothetical protein AFUA_5G08760 [Aspergillus fumigatus Af293]